MPIRAVIFDRDGVLTRFDFSPVVSLFQSLDLSFAEVKELWDRWCGEQPLEGVEQESSFLQGFWTQVIERFGLSGEAEHALRGFEYTTLLRAYSDAAPVLEFARARGLRLGVLSNFPLASLDQSLVAVGLRAWFDCVCAAPVIGARKPSPKAYQSALDALGVSAHECVFVDDEDVCVEGARAHGIHAFKLDRKIDPKHADGGVVSDLDQFCRALEQKIQEGVVALPVVALS